ncbi:MAG TPA: hypothetical protein VL401_03715 [Alphaproteobacteria bacterium]|jgi:hypothetical protein|nr:hypothetical protein [Alphaproteobacteria bacterium]
MSLLSILRGETEIKFNIAEKNFSGKFNYLESNQCQPWRLDTTVDNIPVTGFGESKKEAKENLIQFIKNHPFTH